MRPAGPGSENDCTVEDQQQFVKDRPILSSERMLHKDYDHKDSVEKKIDGRESQSAWCQDELIDVKPPVVKKL
jgi:hypothetical protein